MRLFKIRRCCLPALLPILLFALAGCAKAPSGSLGSTSPTSGPQVFVTLTVAGQINPSYYYFVLFNVNGHGNVGPLPVVAPPFGNGFAAGTFTNFVEFNSGVPGGSNFGFYNISANLLQPGFLGGPASQYLVKAQTTANTISFQMPLAALATASTPVNQIQDIQVNFVATNVVPPPGDTLPNPPKVYCSLQGANQTGTSFVNLITSVNGSFQASNYQNTTSSSVFEYVNGSPQPATDQAGLTTADLSVTNFSMQITSQ